MDQIKIGMYLRKLRTDKGLTQAELAEIIGVSNRSISRWENGSSLPDISLLVWLADFYDVEISSIIHGEEKEETTMNKQDQNTITDIVAYSQHEKELIRKFFFYLFLFGAFLSLLSYLLMKLFSFELPWVQFIIGMSHGFGMGVLILGAVLTSGKAEQIFRAVERFFNNDKQTKEK